MVNQGELAASLLVRYNACQPGNAVVLREDPLSVGVLLFTGCSHLERYERDIHAATREIQGARGNVQRAAAYSQRGSAYSEKARYSRAFKLVAPEEYERLFGLAIKDHEQAIALDPASAGAYYARGRTYYDRAFLETVVNGTWVGTGAERRVRFAPAVADFEKAIEKDPKHHEAWDMLGLTHQATDELDQTIVDYTQEMALNSLGRMRLADAYCERGQLHQKAKEADAAIADYEKSVEYGASADGCSCDPYNPLLNLYSEDRKYDQGWVVVRRAIRAGKWVAPELLSALKKQSGRTN